MQANKRFAAAMSNALAADDRDRKRQRCNEAISKTSSGGAWPSDQIPASVIGTWPRDEWNPEAELLYVNAFVAGGLATSPTGDPAEGFAIAQIIRNYDKVIVQRPCNYRLSVTRLQLPLSSIPLFYYPIGSCKVALGFMDSALSSQYDHAYWFISENDVFIQSLDPQSDIGPGINASYPNGAIAVWSIQQFLDGVNTAIQDATNALYIQQKVVGYPTILQPIAPLITYNQYTRLFTVSFERQAWYGGPDEKHLGTAPPLSVAPPATGNVWPLRYQKNAQTQFLFFNSTLASTYFPSLPQEWTSTWTFKNLGQFNSHKAATAVCLRLNDMLYVPPPEPTGGPPMPLVTVASPPFATTAKVQRVAGTDGLGFRVSWMNPAMPHGLRWGDTVILSGMTSDPTLNKTYTVQSVSSQDLTPFTTGFVTNNANPDSSAWAWQALDPSTSVAISGPWSPATDPNATMTATFGSYLPGQMSSVTSLVANASNWPSGVASIRVLTYGLPIRPEIVPSTSSLSGLTTKNIVLDVPIESRDQFLFDPPPGNYNWVELLGEEALYAWNFTVVWTDSFGNEYPVFIGPGELLEMKALLKRKDIHTQ
jgi:hypothetical protein